MSDKFKSEFRESGPLGCGTFSTVFEAESIKDGKSYAIKKIPMTKEEKDNTIIELEIISSLNSDFVVNYIDSWIEENYYVGSFDDNNRQNISSSNLLYAPNKPFLLHIRMELCSMTLQQFMQQMKKEKLNVVSKEEYISISDIFKQLLECVNYLHELNPPIIHRDLKPENIMLTINESFYKVKVTDFGLSTYHEFVDQSHTKYVGTISYRAPEVETKHYDTKADIWSLGKIMQKLFNFELNSESNDNDLEIQSLYEHAKQICLKCFLYVPKDRPDCKQILSNTYLWNFTNNDKSDTLSLNEKYYHVLCDTLKQRWNIFDKFISKNLKQFRMIEIIEEIEEKAIFVTNDGKVYALRVSDHIDSTIQEPYLINELSNQNIKSIISGYKHVICLTEDMRVYSFGENKSGQLGIGTFKFNNKPSIIKELSNKRIIDIKCGGYHSLALSDNGSVFAWGYGGCGQIDGNGENKKTNTPIKVIGLEGEKIVSISCGYNHSIALSESNTLYGWGDNIEISLDKKKLTIINCDDKIEVKKISCGRDHTLILTSDGDIYSFGYNSFGQLGIGNNIIRNKSTKIQTTIKFIDIETTFYHNLSVGLDCDHIYYIWGECNDKTINSPKQTTFNSFYETFNYYSLNYKVFRTITTKKSFFELNSSFINKINEWSMFKNISHQFMSNIKSLSIVRILERKAILITDDDMVYSFRLNKTIDNSSEQPVIIDEFSKKQIKTITCGFYHVLFLTKNNEVFAFGDNIRGQLGNGSRINSYKPTMVTELSEKQIIEITCGAYHCLAMSETGNIFVWGYGGHGQIGNGDNKDQLTPIEVKLFNMNAIISISCGFSHCLALSSNGELYGWGDNRFGQLGVLSPKTIYVPKLIENLSMIPIKKISCSQFNSMLLTADHSIFSYGLSYCGQFFIANTDDQCTVAGIETQTKFVDIWSNLRANFRAALSQNGEIYIWGKCGDRVITTPTIADFTLFNEIFNVY